MQFVATQIVNKTSIGRGFILKKKFCAVCALKLQCVCVEVVLRVSVCPM